MIQVDGKEFSQAVKVLAKVVPKNPPVVVTETLRYAARDGFLELTATDGTVFVTVTLPCVGEGHGLLPIMDVAKLAKGAAVVRFDSGSFYADGLSMSYTPRHENEFPQALKVKTDWGYVGKELFAALAKVLPFAGTDELRPVFTGVWFNGQDVVACDNHRLMLCKMESLLPRCIVPQQTANVLVQLAKEYRLEGVNIRVDKQQIAFGVGGILVTSRLIPDKIADCQEVFYRPESASKRMTVAAKAVHEVLKKLSSKVQVVNLHLNGGMEIEAFVDSNPVKTTIPATWTHGQDHTVAFNARHLRDMMNAFKDYREVTMDFSGDMHPCIIRGDRELSLTLPVRLF